MAGKPQIVHELGERELLLPNLVNEALTANDRAKYLMTLLQSARTYADHPDLGFADLKPERLASGVEDAELDSVVERSRQAEAGCYEIPAAGRISKQLAESVQQMLAPLELRDQRRLADEDGVLSEPYRRRLEMLLAEMPPATGDRICGAAIDRVTSAQRDAQDSLHLLVMDLHRELNRLQEQVACESISGARVYGIEPADRPLIAAFMAGVNETEKLRFDHPGLGATATRTGKRLVIQNDIGATEAHVLVIHVEPPEARLIYTDVHIQRLSFFQSLFQAYGVRWDDTRSKRSTTFKEPLYHLCVGTFRAADQAELERYLRFLGSRLVFLIDWNRARKRLQKLVPKSVALDVLGWAARYNCGHMGFLKLGGEQLVFDALKFSARMPLGGQLSDILGAANAGEFLKFTLQTAAMALAAGRSELLIRDEIRAELRHYVDTANQGMLEIAAEHATRIVELAAAARDALQFGILADDRSYLERSARRAKRWEHQADELLNQGRAALHGDHESAAVVAMLQTADDVADELEEAIFLLTLLAVDGGGNGSLAALEELAGLLSQGSREYLKAVENARRIDRASSRERIEDFLVAVDRTTAIEHQTDDAHRRAKASILTFSGDFKQLHLFTEIADKLEQAADMLMRSVLILRDHILGEVLTH